MNAMRQRGEAEQREHDEIVQRVTEEVERRLHAAMREREEREHREREGMERREQMERRQRELMEQRERQEMERREQMERRQREEMEHREREEMQRREEMERREREQMEHHQRELERRRDQGAERLEHMNIAAEHLARAGMHEMAEHVRREANAFREELARDHQPPHRPHPPEAAMGQVLEQLEMLRNAVRELQGQIGEMRRNR